MSQRRRWWRWTRRVLIAAVLLVVGAVAFVIIALQTDWGQRQVQREVERALAKTFAGEVAIDRMEVGLSGSVVVEGLRVRYPDGPPAVDVERVSITCDLLPLITGKIRCGELRVVRPKFWQRADAGPLLRPSEEETRLDLEIEAVSIEEGRVEIVGVEVISGIEVRAKQIEVDDLDVKLELERLAATVESQRRQVVLDGSIALVDNVAKLTGVTMTSGDSELEITAESIKLATGELDVAIAGRIAASDLGVEGWRGDIEPDLRVTGVPGESVAIAGRIVAGGGAIEVEEIRIGERLSARLRLDSINPSLLHESAPAGVISSETITADLALGFALPQLEGSVTVPLSGTLEGEDLGEIAIAATADRGRFTATVTAESDRGSGDLDVKAAALLSDWGSVWYLENARVRGQVASLAAFVPGLRTRSAVVNARARGPLSSLATSGSATLTGVSYDGQVSADRAFASVDLRRLDVLASPRPAIGGSFSAEIDGPRFGGNHAASITASGRFSERDSRVSGKVVVSRLDPLESAVVEADVSLGDVITARIRSIDARVGELRWRGSGGVVRKAGDRITTPQRITLRSAAGTVTAGADIRPRRTAINAEIAGFDVWRSRSLHGVDTVRAVIDGEVEVVLAGDRLTGSVAARSDKIAIDGVPPLRGEIAARLTPDIVELEVRGAPVTGTASVDLAITARRPNDIYNPARWLALEVGDLRRVEGAIRGVDTKTIERFTGEPIDAEGEVAVTLRLPYEGRQALGVEIDARRGRYVGIGGLRSHVRASWGDRLESELTFHQAGDDIARGTFGLRAPLHILWRDPASLTRRPLDASVSVTNFSLRRLERLSLVSVSLGGFVTATATASGTIEKPALAIKNGRAARVDIGGLIIPKLFLDANYRGGDEISGRLAGTVRGGGRFEVEGDFKVPGRELQAELNARGFLLEALRPFAPASDHPLADLAGIVDITGVVVNVDPSTLRASGRVRLREGKVLLEGGARAITDINASLVLRGDRIRLARLVAKNGDGRISASGEARFVGYTPKEITVDVKAADIPYVAGSYLASIDLEGKLEGGYADGVLAIRAPISRGRVDLVDTGRELQSIGDLEDVVFVDVRARKKRREAGEEPEVGLRTVIQIDLSRGVRVVMKEVDAVIVGALEAVFVGPQMTRLSGQLRAREGRVKLFERRYELIRAEATFDGPLPMNPDLDLEITRTFPEATVTARVNGRLSQVLSESTQARHIELTSDSNFSEEQILGLMLGQHPDDVAQQDTGGSKVGGIGRAVIASEVRDILRSVGLKVDVVRFHEDGWEFGKWVNFKLGDLFSRRVLLGYRFRDSGDQQANQNEGTVELPITRSINLEGRVGDRGIGNVDLLWIKRF